MSDRDKMIYLLERIQGEINIARKLKEVKAVHESALREADEAAGTIIRMLRGEKRTKRKKILRWGIYIAAIAIAWAFGIWIARVTG